MDWTPRKHPLPPALFPAHTPPCNIAMDSLTVVANVSHSDVLGRKQMRTNKREKRNPFIRHHNEDDEDNDDTFNMDVSAQMLYNTHLLTW